MIGVHNGIVVDQENEKQILKQNQEGYNVKSDSLILFEKLNEYFLKDKENFLLNYKNYLEKIEGNYSIACRVPPLKLNFLSSNCGSLYYAASNNYLFFASEKKYP